MISEIDQVDAHLRDLGPRQLAAVTNVLCLSLESVSKQLMAANSPGGPAVGVLTALVGLTNARLGDSIGGLDVKETGPAVLAIRDLISDVLR